MVLEVDTLDDVQVEEVRRAHDHVEAPVRRAHGEALILLPSHRRRARSRHGVEAVLRIEDLLPTHERASALCKEAL